MTINIVDRMAALCFRSRSPSKTTVNEFGELIGTAAPIQAMLLADESDHGARSVLLGA